MSRRGDVFRPVVAFALSGLAVVALVALAVAFEIRNLARSEAVHDARKQTTLTGHGIVEPALTTAVVRGDPAAIERLDRVVRQRVLSSDVVRIKVWNAEGKIVYSDEPRLIGKRFPLGAAELAVLRSRTVSTETSDLSRPENAYERGHGELTSVYLGLRAQDGTPVMFEEYLRSSAIAGDSSGVARRFVPVGVAALIVLALLQIPLAWRMARRMRDAQRDREELLQHAIEASDRERQTIAAGLHDGVVQELAGVSFQMAAAIEHDRDDPAKLSGALRAGAAGTRNAIRQLRSLLLEIYPPALRDQGLASALPDLAAPLTARGVDVAITVDVGSDISTHIEQLIFRTAQEAMRNVGEHAAATHVDLAVSGDNGALSLRVSDDGRGFDEPTLSQRRSEGHMGLAMLRDLAEAAGGTLEVRSAPGSGTTVELEVPVT
jgi:two-component system NarL family sensor kinase